MEVSTSLRAIYHARLAVKVTALLLNPLSSVSVELGRELDFGLDLMIIIFEGIFGELHTKLILSRIFSFILILHIRVHISVEECIIISVFKL